MKHPGKKQSKKSLVILRLNRFANDMQRNMLSITEFNQLCFTNLLRFSIRINMNHKIVFEARMLECSLEEQRMIRFHDFWK